MRATEMVSVFVSSFSVVMVAVLGVRVTCVVGVVVKALSAVVGVKETAGALSTCENGATIRES